MNEAMEYVNSSNAVIPPYDENHQSLVISLILAPIALILWYAKFIAFVNMHEIQRKIYYFELHHIPVVEPERKINHDISDNITLHELKRKRDTLHKGIIN